MISKVNYIYKRFNNNFISNENQIKIKGIKTKKTVISSFGNEKLEKIDNEENRFTINKIVDTKKEEELKEKIKKESEIIFEEKLQKETEELKDRLKKEYDEKLQERINKEKEELQNKLKEADEELKVKLNKENENLKERLIKEQEEINVKLNNENDDLKKENETLKNKLEIENKEILQQKEKQNILNIIPSKNEEFTLEKTTYDKIINDNFYSVEKIQLNIDKLQKPEIELTEQGVQIEENKPEVEEKTTDTLDLEKKEIKITTKKIIKKTNILKYEFKNNSICKDSKLKIIKRVTKPENSLDKSNIINKIKSFTINKIESDNQN